MTNVRVVKKQPYPFSALIVKTPGAPPLRGQILKVTDIGFLIEVGSEHFFKVGDNHSVEFDVPSTHVTVEAPIKVIKTYDMMTVQEAGAIGKVYTVEMHFRSLEDDEKNAIHHFLKKIGQK